jgi:hypothetical protein
MKIADAAVLVRDGKVLASQIPGARTVLVSRAGEIAGAADPAARGLAAANAFHAAFWVMFVLAALGTITAAIAFERRAPRHIEPEPAPSHVSIVPKASRWAGCRTGGRPAPPRRASGRPGPRRSGAAGGYLWR